jgi:hypothetical protein
MELKVGQQWKGQKTTATITKLTDTQVVYIKAGSYLDFTMDRSAFEAFVAANATFTSYSAYHWLTDRVKQLAVELPGVTFGYIGNVEGNWDDRCWMVFLPHPGRVGKDGDAVRLGATKDLDRAMYGWDLVEAKARKLYHDGSFRVAA